MRRRCYVTVIVSGDTGELLAMVPHRSTEALSRFFAAQGHRLRRREGRRHRRLEGLPRRGGARHPRAGPPSGFAAGLTAVRRDVQRRQPAGVTPVFDPDVFGARFLLLRRPDRLDDSKNCSRRTRACAPRVDCTKAGALAALDRFTDLYQTGDLPEYHKIVNTLLAHMPQILAHAAGRPSNGRIEGTNNLLQVLRRTAHGFTNPHNFAARA